jgi:glycosyltransferase involved in cell wall biosynthesis
MRIAVLHDGTANGYYRAEIPMLALASRGHTAVPFQTPGLERPPWDAVHVHRFANRELVELTHRLRKQGIAIVYDIDDDLGALATHGLGRTAFGVRRRTRRAFDDSFEMARAATVVTTPSPEIASLYADAGVQCVEVVENYVVSDQGSRPPRSGIVIGCVAAKEHAGDFKRLGIRQALAGVLERHPQVRVVSVGVDLKLNHARYTYRVWVPVGELVSHGRLFDIGYAPLTDNAFNRARSNVKLKEYAAAGVPWLASPVGPYAALGEHEGGQLVSDSDWATAFERLVEDFALRRRLARNARSWAASQSLAVAAAKWERVYRAALRRRTAAKVAR